MAQGAISDQISRHVEAVVVLSKRDILLRLLREAELCVEQNAITAAAILADIVLEESYLLADPTILRGHERSFEVWRQLRNTATHSMAGGIDIDREAVTTMLKETGALLEQMDAPERTPTRQDRVSEIRGKYAFVPTSVDEFLKRKREELEFEDQQ